MHQAKTLLSLGPVSNSINTYRLLSTGCRESHTGINHCRIAPGALAGLDALSKGLLLRATSVPQMLPQCPISATAMLQVSYMVSVYVVAFPSLISTAQTHQISFITSGNIYIWLPWYSSSLWCFCKPFALSTGEERLTAYPSIRGHQQVSGCLQSSGRGSAAARFSITEGL